MEKSFTTSIVAYPCFFYTQCKDETAFSFLCPSAFPDLTLYFNTGLFKIRSAQEAPTPTPTYDPLAEPFVPENPSEYELGRIWYWHNCITCHGDIGQGLTDEFRAIWPENHQNYWGRGCHGGRQDDEGFPIPTYVPPLVDERKLAQFSSQEAFYEFLKSAHPKTLDVWRMRNTRRLSNMFQYE